MGGDNISIRRLPFSDVIIDFGDRIVDRLHSVGNWWYKVTSD
jgi:hypothetical protein